VKRPLRFPPDPGARPKPRSGPGGSRSGGVSPLADPRRVAPEGPKSFHRFPCGSGPAEAAPSPQARIEAEASPVALFDKRRAEAFPPFEEPLGAEALRNPLSDCSAARKPCHFPGAPLESRNLLVEPRFRSRLGRKPFPVSPPARVAGRFPRPSPFGGPSRLARSPFGVAMESFVKSRLASACAYAGAASSASPAFRFRRQRPWGSDGAFGLGPRLSVWKVRFRSNRPFRPQVEAVSFPRFGKGESPCG
jgi:hypothetical protein